jgi:hypothetical protein
MIAGYNSEKRDGESDNRYQYQSGIQGCVIDKCNTANQSYTGFTTRHPHGCTVRNNTAYYVGNHQFWSWSSQYNIKYYNNYSTRSSYANYLNDAFYDAYSEISYNYFTRSDDYGFMIHHNRGNNNPIRHNYVLHSEQRPFYCYYFTNDTVIERLYLDGFRSQPHVGSGNGTVQFLDCFMDNKWFKSIHGNRNGSGVDTNRYLSYGGQDGNGRYWNQSGSLQRFVSYEHNFKYDAKLTSLGGGVTFSDSDTPGYMKVFTLAGNDYTPFVKTVYVPAATIARISAKMNLSTNSHTRPYLYAAKSNGYRNSGGRYITTGTDSSHKASNHADNSAFYGFLQYIQFTSSAQGAWEEKQITITAQDKGYFLQVGIFTKDDSRDEVHLLRDIDIYLDSSIPLTKADSNGKSPQKRGSFTPSKKRIGGTRL